MYKSRRKCLVIVILRDIVRAFFMICSRKEIQSENISFSFPENVMFNLKLNECYRTLGGKEHSPTPCFRYTVQAVAQKCRVILCCVKGPVWMI